ncbi:hypothetical protein LWI28_017869 [Acer negundo]|uniref:Uncharacterized protein n=1 Tax=Acer negundo TaxID=4023 RepID=A0AAD5JK94_ACENE|nr:hypothetical protein LWI28_017869 [Acer negundo]
MAVLDNWRSRCPLIISAYCYSDGSAPCQFIPLVSYLVILITLNRILGICLCSLLDIFGGAVVILSPYICCMNFFSEDVTKMRVDQLKNRPLMLPFVIVGTSRDIMSRSLVVAMA